MDAYRSDDCWPSLAQFCANSVDMRRLEEGLRDADSFQERLALSRKLAVCRGRAAAYTSTLRTSMRSYRGFLIRASFKYGYMVVGKQYLGFANDLADAKRIIDEQVTRRTKD
jgi:hypothetical protein